MIDVDFMKLKKILLFLVLMVPFVVHAGELNITNFSAGCSLLESNENYLMMDNCILNNSFMSYLEKKHVGSIDVYMSSYEERYSAKANYNSNRRMTKDGDDIPKGVFKIKINKIYVPDVSGVKKYLNDDFKDKNEEAWDVLNNIYEHYSLIKTFGDDNKIDVIELKKDDSFKVGDANVLIIEPVKDFAINEDEDGSISDFVGDFSLVSLVSIDNTKYLLSNYLTDNVASAFLTKNANLKIDMIAIDLDMIDSCESIEFIKSFKSLNIYLGLLAVQLKVDY